MLGLIQKCSGYVLHGRPACNRNWARSEVPDLISLCPIQFHSCEEGRDHIVQSQPGSNLDGLVMHWPNGSGLEASWCAGIIGPTSGGTQAACYQFPTFRLSCVLPQTAFFMTAQSRCVQESLGPLLANASVLIQTGCGSDPARLLGYSTFTGILRKWGGRQKVES